MDETMDGEAKQSPPVPEWAVPAKRSDAVGMLAWQLVGEPGGMPDFSAAVPLADALRDAGDFESAIRFEKSIAGLVGSMQSRLNRPSALRNWLSECSERTHETARHLLYDFGSITSVLARAVELAAAPAPAPVEETAVGVSIVRADLGGYRSPGARVQLPDGRRGVVIEETNADGTCRVLLDANA